MFFCFVFHSLSLEFIICCGFISGKNVAIFFRSLVRSFVQTTNVHYRIIIMVFVQTILYNVNKIKFSYFVSVFNRYKWFNCRLFYCLGFSLFYFFLSSLSSSSLIYIWSFFWSIYFQLIFKKIFNKLFYVDFILSFFPLFCCFLLLFQIGHLGAVYTHTHKTSASSLLMMVLFFHFRPINNQKTQGLTNYKNVVFLVKDVKGCRCSWWWPSI